jgi:hypothetical protein
LIKEEGANAKICFNEMGPSSLDENNSIRYKLAISLDNYSDTSNSTRNGGRVCLQEDQVDRAQEPEAKIQVGPRPDPRNGGRTPQLFGNYLLALLQIAGRDF